MTSIRPRGEWVLILLAGLFCCFSLQGEKPEKQKNFPSPGGVWEIVATEADEGWSFYLLNKKSGKKYFEHAGDGMLPRRFNAGWNEAGDVVCLNIRMGKAAFEVSLIVMDSSGPHEVLLRDILPEKYLDYQTSASWLGNRLEVDARAPFGSKKEDRRLLVEFKNGRGKFVKELPVR